MTPLAFRALLWDVDGTLAETERDGHRVAFNRAFEDEGVPWRWDERHYGALLRVAGGRERLLADMADRPEAPTSAAAREALAAALHDRKNRHYADIVAAGTVTLRDGVTALLDEAAARGLPMGIVSTTRRDNLEALLRATLGPGATRRFDVVVCGEDVRAKKPDPEAYRRALAVLGLAGPDVLALEDSPAGVASARGAGIAVVVTRSQYFPDDAVDGAIAVGPGLHTRQGWSPPVPVALVGTSSSADRLVGLDDLAHWWRHADEVVRASRGTSDNTRMDRDGQRRYWPDARRRPAALP